MAIDIIKEFLILSVQEHESGKIKTEHLITRLKDVIDSL